MIEQPVAFKENKIELNIPKGGLDLEGGWKIHPLAAPIVSASTHCKCTELYSCPQLRHFPLDSLTSLSYRFSSLMWTLTDFISDFLFAS